MKRTLSPVSRDPGDGVKAAVGGRLPGMTSTVNVSRPPSASTARRLTVTLAVVRKMRVTRSPRPSSKAPSPSRSQLTERSRPSGSVDDEVKTTGCCFITVGTAKAATGGRFTTLKVFWAVAAPPSSSTTRSRTRRVPGTGKEVVAAAAVPSSNSPSPSRSHA